MLNKSQADVAGVVEERIAQSIADIKEGKIRIQPGFDGEYGYPVFDGTQVDFKKFQPKPSPQKSLMDF